MNAKNKKKKSRRRDLETFKQVTRARVTVPGRADKSPAQILCSPCPLASESKRVLHSSSKPTSRGGTQKTMLSTRCLRLQLDKARHQLFGPGGPQHDAAALSAGIAIVRKVLQENASTSPHGWRTHEIYSLALKEKAPEGFESVVRTHNGQAKPPHSEHPVRSKTCVCPRFCHLGTLVLTNWLTASSKKSWLTCVATKTSKSSAKYEKPQPPLPHPRLRVTNTRPLSGNSSTSPNFPNPEPRLFDQFRWVSH